MVRLILYVMLKIMTAGDAIALSFVIYFSVNGKSVWNYNSKD